MFSSFLPVPSAAEPQDKGAPAMSWLTERFESLLPNLQRRMRSSIWPMRVKLSTGRHCEVKPADDAAQGHACRHYVLIFPAAQGKAGMEESLEMFALSMLFARALARLALGNAERYTISKNGEQTGSVPDIEHYHLYLFEDRREKIMEYAKNVIPALRRLRRSTRAAQLEPLTAATGT